MNKTRHLSYITMLSALAIVINLFESAFIPPIQFGIRFGLANIIALITINLFTVKDMLVVNTMRVTIGNLLKGMIFGSPFWISFSGVVFSSLAIVFCHKINSSLIFTSIMSAIFHSFGQVLMVMFFYNQANIIALLPILLVSSIATGVLTGVIASQTLKRVRVR